ncbi:ATP-binding protein [Streptomyces scabichelini]|uniref:ATP-binding protein n=1 Tax=Streptomyces scabichelini TaxID=2711217 RepID=UPI0030B9BAB5
MNLVEREWVLAKLAGHLGQADRGDGRLVLLRGEAGIGKSAVVRRFCEQVDAETRVLVGSCDPLSTPPPLGPLMDIASGLGTVVKEALEAALSGTSGPNVVFRALLDELSGGPVTLLVFEDVHWADAATLDLLRFVGRRIGELPALVVVTYRDDEVGPLHPLSVVLGDLAGCPALARYDLEPLSRSAVARLAVRRPHDPAALYAITEGNPFFVTEVLAASEPGIPVTVREAVIGRLGRLPAHARDVVEAAAVVGTSAPVDLLGSIVANAETAVDEVLTAGVLEAESTQLAFRHELARAAVLDSIPAIRRRRLHALVLNALRAPTDGSAPDLSRLAYHADEAGDAEAVLKYAPAAAAHASRLTAHREAAAQFARALRHAGAAPQAQRATLLEGHAYASYMTGLVPDAVESWETAGRLRHAMGDLLHEGDDLRWCSYMLWLLSRNREARERGIEAVRLLGHAGPTPELGRAYVNVAEQAGFDCDVATTAAHAERAIEVGRHIGDAGLVLRARFHAAIATVLSQDHGWEELEEVWQQAAARQLVEHAGMFGPVISAVAMVHRDFDRARDYDRRAVAFCRHYDLDMFLDYLRGARAMGLVHQGAWEEAAEEATAVLRLRSLPPVSRIFPLLALALVRVRRGDPEVRPLLDEAATLGEPSDLVRMGPVWEARAEAAWLAGDDASAIAEASRGLPAVGQSCDPWAVGACARWIRLAGGRPPPGPAAGPFALELSGDWAAAVTAWQRLGCAYDAALAQLAGDAEAVAKAVATFDALGARAAVVRGRVRLKELGVRLGTRGPRTIARAHQYGLTAREQEIVDLLREGLSGPDIAARLFITPKTVSHHVTAILQKLGVHSRAEALRKLGS